MNALAHLAAPWMPHLMLAPIALPMFTAALLLLLREEQQRLKFTLSVLSTLLGLAAATALLAWSDLAGSATGLGVYLPGNWPAPFGIVLALDRLTALMLVLTSVLALCAVVFSGARWQRAGVHFQSLFQFQLMGLAGAFLTADLFNLFVFFEIMLAASYGLLLHGSGPARIGAGLHYIAINLAASSLFLIGAAMLYGITGTLNMADLSAAVAEVTDGDRGLLHTASAILATAFLTKAAVWPLNFWLVPAYSSATAPVGALFAIMTKVGVYAIVRLWTLMFGPDAGASALFGAPWLIGAGMATMVFGAVGMMGSQRLSHLAGHAAVLSSGTLLAAAGFGQPGLLAGLLYYLPSSTLAVAALYLLDDLIARWRNGGASLAPYEQDDTPFLTADLLPTANVNLDDDEEVLVGRVIQAAAAFIGLAFLVSTLVVAGLPPLSGFVGKLAMLSALLDPLGLGASSALAPTAASWLLLALMLITGFAALMALTRAGIRHFWGSFDRMAPELRVLEGLPIALLLAACMALAVQAEAVMGFTRSAAAALHAPTTYVRAVMSATPRPGPGATLQESAR